MKHKKKRETFVSTIAFETGIKPDADSLWRVITTKKVGGKDVPMINYVGTELGAWAEINSMLDRGYEMISITMFSKVTS